MLTKNPFFDQIFDFFDQQLWPRNRFFLTKILTKSGIFIWPKIDFPLANDFDQKSFFKYFVKIILTKKRYFWPIILIKNRYFWPVSLTKNRILFKKNYDPKSKVKINANILVTVSMSSHCFVFPESRDLDVGCPGRFSKITQKCPKFVQERTFG